MSIPVSCPFCRSQLQAKDEQAGRSLKCPQCGNALTVPAPDSPFGENSGRAACRECGAYARDGDSPFCPDCGASFKAAPLAPPETPPELDASNQWDAPADPPFTNGAAAPPHPVPDRPEALANASVPTPKIPVLSDGEMIVRGYHFASAKGFFRLMPLGWCHITLTNKRLVFNSLTYQWFQRNEQYIEVPMDSVGSVKSAFLNGFPLLRTLFALAAAVFLYVYAASANRVSYMARVPVEIERITEVVYDRDAQVVHRAVIEETVRGRDGKVYRQVRHAERSWERKPPGERLEDERIMRIADAQPGTEPETRHRWGYGLGLLACAPPLLYAIWMTFFSKRKDLVFRVCSTKAMEEPIDVDGPKTVFRRILTSFGLYALFSGFADPMKYQFHDVTPTSHTWKMIREIGAIVIDIQTQGDIGAEKWRTRP